LGNSEPTGMHILSNGKNEHGIGTNDKGRGNTIVRKWILYFDFFFFMLIVFLKESINSDFFSLSMLSEIKNHIMYLKYF